METNEIAYCKGSSKLSEYFRKVGVGPRPAHKEGLVIGGGSLSGDCSSFYYFKENGMWGFKSSLPPGSVVLTFEEYEKKFLKEYDYSLPEKWYVKVTPENREIVERWRHFGRLIDANGYINSDDGYWSEMPPKGYKEITTEQFKRYITKGSSKWYIKDNEEVSSWASRVFNCGNFPSDDYLHIDLNKFPAHNSYMLLSKPQDDYCLVTLEDLYSLATEPQPKSFDSLGKESKDNPSSKKVSKIFENPLLIKVPKI